MHKIRLWVLLLGVIMGCATGGHPGATSRSTDAHLLLNRTWQWEATATPAETISVSDPDRYTIRFLEDGNLQARFDCNRGGGSYTILAGKLSLGPMMSTRMACAPDSLDAVFMRDLQRVKAFYIENGTLNLAFPEDGGTMRFKPEG
jgi:heat shock protein HslJ